MVVINVVVLFLLLLLLVRFVNVVIGLLVGCSRRVLYPYYGTQPFFLFLGPFQQPIVRHFVPLFLGCIYSYICIFCFHHVRKGLSAIRVSRENDPRFLRRVFVSRATTPRGIISSQEARFAGPRLLHSLVYVLDMVQRVGHVGGTKERQENYSLSQVTRCRSSAMLF